MVDHHKYHDYLKLVRNYPQLDSDRILDFKLEIIYKKVESHGKGCQYH